MTVLNCLVLQLLAVSLKELPKRPVMSESLIQKHNPLPPILLLQLSPCHLVPSDTLFFNLKNVFICLLNWEAPWRQEIFLSCSPYTPPHLEQCLQCSRCSVHFHWTDESFPSCSVIFQQEGPVNSWTVGNCPETMCPLSAHFWALWVRSHLSPGLWEVSFKVK